MLRSLQSLRMANPPLSSPDAVALSPVLRRVRPCGKNPPSWCRCHCLAHLLRVYARTNQAGTRVRRDTRIRGNHGQTSGALSFQDR